MAQAVVVTKSSGEREPFDEGKLRTSLLRAGATSQAAEDIVEHIAKELEDGITTSRIYRHAFLLLKKQDRIHAARYSMKRALLALGPSGFPFERFVGEIFKARGYATKTGVEVKGRCATHELDLLAQKGEKRIVAELKFHNHVGMKSDLKDVLYVKARFEDLAHVSDGPPIEGWFITNTKFTSNASEYGRCAGMTLIAWTYPSTGNLQDLIEETGVQPLTSLTTLSSGEKMKLLENKVVLCRAIGEEPGHLERIGLSHAKIDAVVAESQALCGARSTPYNTEHHS